MRNLKRALSLALASVMLVGMMVVGTGAAYADVTAKHNKGAIEVMELLGIMTGDEKGNFNPDKAVTRNEMAVVMVNLMDLNTKDYAGSTPFVDVPAWAEPYVAACYANKIVSGTSATTYGGDQTVTTAEAALMMQKALGYFQFGSDFGDDWMVATVKQGSKIDLFDGISSNAKAALTRNDVAKLALNALEAFMVEPDGNGGTTIKGEGFEITTGSTKYEEQDETLLQNLFGDDVTVDEDANDELGRPATKWTYEDDDVLVVEDADYVVTLTKSYTDEQKLLDVAKKDIEAADDNVYAINGADADFEDLGAGDTLYIYTNDEKEVTGVYAARYILGKIDEVDTDVSKADEEDGVAAYVDFTNDFDFSEVDVHDNDIAGFNAKTYVEDAVIALLVSEADDFEGDIVDSYVVKSVEGSVGTKKVTSEQGYMTIGGTKYIEAEGAGVVSAVETGSDNTYKFFVDANGYVLGYETVDEAAISIDETYVLESVWYTSTSGKNNEAEYKYFARLIALDGTVKVVELEAEGEDYVLEDGEISREALGLDEVLFVTVSDKEIKKDGVKVAKKDDNKVNLAAWDFEDGKYELAASLDGKVEAEDNKNGTIRLNGKTQYLMMAVEDDEVTTAVYTGGVNFTFDDATNVVLVDSDKATTALYVIAYCGDDADNVKQDKVESEDYVYVDAFDYSESEHNADYAVVTVYTATGATAEWQVATEDDLDGFYTYTKNSDGYYELEEAEDVISTATARDWDADKATDIGVIVDATAITTDALDQNLLTVGNLADINVKGAKFVDLHDDDAEGAYERSINSLTKLDSLLDNGKVVSFKLSMSIDENGAVIIFLTEANAVAE